MLKVVTAECVRCHKTRPGSAFRADGTHYAHLCVKCKIELTLTPERVAEMQQEVTRTLTALLENQ